MPANFSKQIFQLLNYAMFLKFVKLCIFIVSQYVHEHTHVESVSLSFLRNPKAFLVRFFSPITMRQWKERTKTQRKREKTTS